MKKLIVTLLAFVSLTAAANCTQQTYVDGSGKMVICTTCCQNGYCQSWCS